MMTLPPAIGWPFGIVRHRLIERPWWRWRNRRGLPVLREDEIRAALPDGARPEWLAAFGAYHRTQFGWGPEDVATWRDMYAGAGGDPGTLIARAEAIVARRFEVLGSGVRELGSPIDWHQDFKSGHRFPRAIAWRIDYADRSRDSDVKVPWELARMHWALVLGQAYWWTGDGRFAEAFRALVDEWLDDNPPGVGIHWACPMEIAIRAMNLAYAFAMFRGAAEVPEATWARMLSSLLWHGRVIRANLEYGRRLGNHFIADLAGLLVLGRMFGQTREGRRWAGFARRQLETQLRWQVHPDGMSREKSVSYHRLVLELLLVATAVGRRGGERFSPEYLGRLERMLEYVRAYSRPDGTTPLISDADDGRVTPFAPWRPITDHRHVLALGAAVIGRRDLWEEAEGDQVDAFWVAGPEACDAIPDRRAPRQDAFPAGGCYVIRGAGCHTFLDAGALGFEGDLVHGHLDTLALELATPAGVLLSDSGCFAYTSDPAAYREHVRTRAHNTVVIDGADQADLLRMWRIAADRTAPRVLRWDRLDHVHCWEAEHHGYARLPGGVVHRRRVEFDAAAIRWTIRDHLTGAGTHQAEVFWHAGIGVEVRTEGPMTWALARPGGVLRLASSAGGTVESGWVAPSYGVRVAAPVIRVSLTAEFPVTITTTLEWIPAPDGRKEQAR